MSNLIKFAARLFSKHHEREQFLSALHSGRSGKTALVWMSERPNPNPFLVCALPEWAPGCIDVLSDSDTQRPGSNALHSSGAYYVLDLSSVFAARPLFDLFPAAQRDLIVFDVCAAPGGKSMLGWKALSPAMLIANESIGKRIPVLISNFKRCHIAPAAVTSMDPKNLRQRMAGIADVVLVDAPCSGQSLIAKRSSANSREQMGAFHPSTINLNSNRQKRILAHSAALLRGGGALLYMTCTFAREENESVVEWFLKKFPFFEPLHSNSLDLFQSSYADFPCYRLLPQHGFGAGAFTCLLRRNDDLTKAQCDFSRVKVCWRSD